MATENARVLYTEATTGASVVSTLLNAFAASCSTILKTNNFTAASITE